MMNTDVKLGGGSAGASGLAGHQELESSGEASGTLNPEAQDAISRQLRQVYGDLLNAPMPDKFKSLLASLAGEETKE